MLYNSRPPIVLAFCCPTVSPTRRLACTLNTSAVGRVSLTWADIRGNNLLHLAAQHNDVALVQVPPKERSELGARMGIT